MEVDILLVVKMVVQLLDSTVESGSSRRAPEKLWEGVEVEAGNEKPDCH